MCNKSYTIPDTDITVEQGTRVFIPALGIHYDPEFYPDPEKFDPERFSEENKAARPNFTWLPFGEGPRICIGTTSRHILITPSSSLLLSFYQLFLIQCLHFVQQC
nr:unnamed protein product [Callosobruchus analis]